MKIFTRIICIFMAALMAAGLTVPAQAALTNDLHINTIGGSEGLFEVQRSFGGSWVLLPVPFWATVESRNISYCLESDMEQPKGEGYNITQSLYSGKVLTGIQAILMHGAPNNLGGLTGVEAVYATQIAIWCWMNEAANVGHSFYLTNRIRATSGNEAVYAYFVSLLAKARAGDVSVAHNLNISSNPIELTDNGKGQLTGTTTVRFTNLNGSYAIDQNKVPTGVTVQGNTYLNGDTITITAPTSYAGQTVSMKGVIFATDTRTPANVFWYAPNSSGLQNMLVYDYTLQPVLWLDMSFTSQSLGELSIIKTVTNGSGLAGFQFELRRGGQLIGTYTTDTQGKLNVKDLLAGTYTVKEVNLPPEYVTPANNPREVVVEAGKTTTLAWENVKKQGQIIINKSNTNPAMGDYSLAGAVFEILNSAGTVIDTVTTNTQGEAKSKLLPLGSYKVREKTAPHGFVLNKTTYDVAITPDTQNAAVIVETVAVPEQPQTGKIIVTKKDAETGDTAQGDAALTGAVFEVFASDKSTLVDTLYCGTDVRATTKELPLGTYYVREKTAPVGYNLNEGYYQVKLEYAGQDIAITSSSYNLKNKVIKGQVAIVKHTDQTMEGYDDPQIEQPLEGAVFELYLKSSGAYDKAKDSECDLLTTNENGYALSKELPYGVYTIKEISAPGDVKLVAPYDVFVSKEGHIYRFILNDPAYTARVKIVKMDADSGKVIPAAGTSFKVKDLKTGAWVKQSVWYPTPAQLDVFETGVDGTLMLPEPLVSGEYELHEVQAPVGYLLSTTPVKFTINSTQQEAIVTVTMKNKPVMGKIAVEKQGEMLTSAVESETKFGTLLTPVFEMQSLKGAVFSIIAAEDIVTPDGTVHAKKGDVVDTITTGDKGTATSKDLHLGNYLAVETKAPAGFVLDKTPHPVSLVYEDQHTNVVSSQVGIDDVRQRVEISLNKVMEKPIGADEDFSAFQDVVFGFFAGEDFDGILPKGALVATITLDENGYGIIAGDLPFGKFYVKELQTNSYYQLNDTVYAIDVAYAGQDAAVTKIQVNNGGAIPNELKLGKIVLEKHGEVFVGAEKTANGYTPIYELRGLPGAVFDVIAAEDIYDVSGKLIVKKGTVVDTITTGEDGKAESQPLRLGRYEIIETAAPEGFVLDTERHAVALDFNGQVEEVLTKQLTVLNERCRMEIRVKKTWEMPANAPKDFAPWKDIQFGLYAKADILAADGSVAIPAGALIETISIDKDGSGKAAADLPSGSYYVQEIKTAKGYVLDNKKHDVLFGSTDKAVTAITVNAVNKLQRGSLRIVKTFEDRTTPLAGVPFLVVGQTAFGEIRMEVKTDRNGEIVLNDLPNGTYTVTEQKSDITANYLLAPAQTVTITAGKETTVKIINQLVKGEIRVLKVDEETGKPLAGAMFGLYKDGELIAEAKSGKDGYAIFKDVAFGEYEIRELSAPVGYMRSEDVLKAIVGKDGSVVLFEVTNAKIPGEPVQPEEPEIPVTPNEKPPKTGDNTKTVVTVVLVVLIIAGGVVLFLRKRGKPEEETTEEETE